MLKEFAHRYTTVIEVGSSLGITGSIVLSRLDSEGVLVAVEADPNLVGTLAETLERNRQPRQLVHVVNSAVSYGDSHARFSIGDTSVGGRLSSDDDSSDEATAVVSAVRLADIVERFGIGRGFLLICDIEGAEHSMLDNDKQAILQAGGIIIEMHDDRGRSWTEVRAKLLGWGFREEAGSGRVAYFVGERPSAVPKSG